MANFAHQAPADLDHLVGWLLDEGYAAAAAERVLKAILDAAEMLGRRPLLGRARLDLLPEPFRFWSISRHSLLVIYDPTGATPTILRVLSTDRDLGPLLGDPAALHGKMPG